eukprot:16361713-Heterocapsa_arctica.AAC.1
MGHTRISSGRGWQRGTSSPAAGNNTGLIISKCLKEAGVNHLLGCATLLGKYMHLPEVSHQGVSP